MMNKLVADFSSQLQKALLIAQSAQLNTSSNPIQNVLISGLGGSGIGGSIVAEIVAQEATCPITINKDYFTPAFVNQNTLAIICSYSGNTEETIQVLKKCIELKAKVVIITSGGEAAKIAEANSLDYILLPAGFPPRSCIGYSIAQIIKVLGFFNIISSNYLNEIDGAIALLEKEEEDTKQKASEIAHKLVNKLPIIYSLGNTEGVSIRFRQQLNENSKMLCWHHVLPEMNHNELVGWADKQENVAVVIFRYSNDYYRNIKRLEVCKTVFEANCDTVIEITAKGNSPLQEALYLIHLGDWISCYIADIRQIDAVNIDIINHLKGELSKLR